MSNNTIGAGYENSNCRRKGLSFRIYPKTTFDKRTPIFRKPNEIGSYSLDENRCFKHDKRNMKYYIAPINPSEVEFDLTVGYKNMIRKDEHKKEYLDNILHWILLNKSKFQLQNEVDANPNTW